MSLSETSLESLGLAEMFNMTGGRSSSGRIVAKTNMMKLVLNIILFVAIGGLLVATGYHGFQLNSRFVECKKHRLTEGCDEILEENAPRYKKASYTFLGAVGLFILLVILNLVLDDASCQVRR